MTSITILLLTLYLIVNIVADIDENCKYWAEIGECVANPKYMLEGCKESCRNVTITSLRDVKEVASIESFFDLSAKDIHGVIVEFSRFRGQVTILTNVASYCRGYTDSHYRGVSFYHISF